MKHNDLLNSLRKVVLLALGSCLILSFSNLESSILPLEQLVADPCTMENKAFQAGEEITYKLYYNWNFVWVPAGEVTFRVQETTKQYRLTATGRTYSSYEWFYRVRDRYDSFVDKKSLLPSISIRELQEGGYRLYDKTSLDQKRGIASCERGKTRERTKVKTHSIDRCMHDVLSIIYYARNLDFETFNKGDHFPIQVFMDAKTYPLQVAYKGKRAGKAVKGKGKYDTILFSPQLIAGEVFEEGAEMDIWVTDDKNRIPVLIESPLSLGSVKAVLKSYKGLKYKMTAERK